ncbi:MAG TPA: glycoside hydrolase family 36 protein, partial [Acidobacteriaceae bacterium]|nr:glycoside hydrolase family 36 protein [Acidobacteriaceae bacterium]
LVHRLYASITCSLFAVSLALPYAGASAGVGATATIRTDDVQLELKAGEHAPMLITLSGTKGNLWRNSMEEALPQSVDLRGKATNVHWSLKPELTLAHERSVEFVYETAVPHLRLRWMWGARASSGPVEHRIVIENLSGEEMWLPLMESLTVNWQITHGTTLNHFYVEKGADSPSADGAHLKTVADGYRWIGRSSTYARPVPGEEREIIPVEFVYDAADSQTSTSMSQAGMSHAGWFAGIEFSGRTRITLQHDGLSLRSSLGLNADPATFRTRLEAGGSFETPTVFLGAFDGGLDGAGNQLRPWVRAVLGNPQTWKDRQYPLLVSNSWGSGMQVDEPLALRMIKDAKELGLEVYHVDAGWFRGVGDWYPDAKKFPHGLGFIADEAHRQGLRFGIWVDWSQAGIDTTTGALNAHDAKVRDWLVNDVGPEWKPEEFKGQTIDIGLPAAHDYAAKEVKRIVEDYHLDMLEHDGYLVAQGCMRDDHPHAPVNKSTQHIVHDSGFDFVEGSNAADVSYHAVRAYYDIYERLRREHPGLLLEICNDGGRMMDFGSAAHGDYFSITDTYDPLSNRRAFYDASFALPPAMLESYVEKWPVHNLANFRYMLRSGMMGWMTLMQDSTAWTAEQHEAARQAFELYKEKLRPLIRDGDLYHVSERPDGVHWDGMEYWDATQKRGVVYAFRGSTPTEDEHVYRLSGLSSEAKYRLHFQDGSSPDREATGQELMARGLTVHLGEPLSSELVFIEQAAANR